MIRCPNCNSQARIKGMSMITAVYCPTTYDENGNVNYSDTNTQTDNWTCLSCGHKYISKTRYGVITISKGE